MVEVLKKKLLRLILLLENPKEEVLEILPFLLGKAILIAINDKVEEELSTLYGLDDRKQAEIKVH